MEEKRGEERKGEERRGEGKRKEKEQTAQIYGLLKSLRKPSIQTFK